MSQQQQSRKRPSQYKINQKTLEDHQQGDHLPKQPPSIPPTDRKIYSIKKDHSDIQPQKTNFALNNNKQEQPKKENTQTDLSGSTKTQVKGQLFKFPNNGVGLFSNVTPTIFTTNMFTSNSGTQATSKSIANAPPTTLFGGKNIFSNKSLQGQTIFNFNNKIPQVKVGTTPTSSLFGGNQQEGSGDEAQLQAAQKIQIDKSKSSGKYKYQQTSKVIINKLARKYKKNNHDLVERVEIQIHTDKDNKNYWLLAKLPQTKNGVSTLRNINGKKENIQIIVLTIKDQKSTDIKNKFQKNTIRLQFDEVIDAEALYKELQKII